MLATSFSPPSSTAFRSPCVVLFLNMSFDVLKGIGIMRVLAMWPPCHRASVNIPRFSLKRAQQLHLSGTREIPP